MFFARGFPPEFNKCTTYACDTVRMNLSREPCMRRQEVTTLRAIARLKEDNRPKYTVSPLLFTWNIMATGRGQGFLQLTPRIQIPTRSAHQTFRIRSHGSSNHCAFHIHALLLAEQSLGESVTVISSSKTWRSSECFEGPPSNGVCSRDLVMSLANSESKISPLTASAVTRATTSFHTSPPFTVVRLVREVMSVRVHAATDLNLDKTVSSICVCGLCISYHDKVFVNRSAPLSTPATFLKFSSPFAAFSWIHKYFGIHASSFCFG